MIIGIPREIGPQEGRVALLPSAIRVLATDGHTVFVEQGAGQRSGLPDDEYIRAGAFMVPTAEDVYGRADLLWKVNEPLVPEIRLLRPGQVIFSFLHLAASSSRTESLMKSGVVAIAAETLQAPDGSLPVLKSMSEVAGRLAIQVGARCLETAMGGCGLLLGGVPGVPPARVAVLGGGTVGFNAARTAQGLGADVTVLDVDMERLRWFDNNFPGRVRTLHASPTDVEESLLWADLVIGAVHVTGARTPCLVSRDQLGLLRPGSVLVDVAVDQGGCFESSKPTTHADPTFILDGIVHYAVPNMPGAVARTSTAALSHAALRYGRCIAGLGWREAARQDPAIRAGLCISPS